jgi:hypothetical protein
MNIFNFFKSKKETVTEKVTPMISEFSTPFGKIGDGNLALPFVRAYSHTEPYIRFGTDNLYPQVINQMYYTSPLNGGIINFKTNATIGGGYTLESITKTAKEKVNEYTFLKRIKFDKLCKSLTKDFIMHNRIALLICNKNGQKYITRLSPDTVRINYYKNTITVCEDWARNVNICTYPVYNPAIKEDSVYYYELEGDAGQNSYPIPSYCSSLNWCFVDGQMSYLQKSNLINSIFPSFMITMAKKFESDVEARQFKDTIEKAKGAPEAGRIMTFVAEFPENLPTVTTLPQNNNDKLFIETVTNLEANICRSHSIDPLIMGIRVSGKLGSGNELVQAYSIFEKNVIMPLRSEMEDIFNDIMLIGGYPSKIKINEFQIIDTQIIQTK